ncbi:hypothetical protein FC756_23275 [Lysinibacillus mangiferihumi]|uniref:Uncharacterized protein n=1 Tax=Lysinibacillus mangiferihumi TaxID=1130819 RepID=A0A4U2Y336_9BACI|nr:hypothetical protein [Lysinibacillus mangiferihumi]TKI53551.1 hypothetical protein FC756_23275 [Lysinibacillus mangiferihumi]
MFIYAQLNNEDIVVGISQLSGKVDNDNMILINDLKVVMGSTYNRQTGEFTPPVISEPTPNEPQPTLEEMQAQTLLNTEVLIAMKNIGV